MKYIHKYIKRLTKKIEKMMNNIDIICDALINKNEKEENFNELKSSSINSDNKKIWVLKMMKPN